MKVSRASGQLQKHRGVYFKEESLIPFLIDVLIADLTSITDRHTLLAYADNELTDADRSQKQKHLISKLAFQRLK